MTTDDTRMCELLVGLPDVAVLAVDESADGLIVKVETRAGRDWCASCGVRAAIKERPVVDTGDLRCFGRPVTLAWRKRRWHCPEAACGEGSWTEVDDRIASARCGLTRRAGLWATEQVGRLARPVSTVAGELGVSWHTVMDAVVLYGSALVDDPDRVGQIEVVGADETKWLAARADQRTRWVTSIVDVDARRIADLVEGRNAADLGAWLAAQGHAWCNGVEVAVCDLHEPFRAAYDRHLPDAVQVADPFHVVGVGTRVVDKVRRRVQNNTLGHRGRRHDPLYRARKVLTMAEERLDEPGRQRLRGLLAAGDPRGEVADAHAAKECLRELYTLYGAPDIASGWIDALTEDLADHQAPELRGMARTLRRWRGHILAWHTTGASNGITEGLNALIKKVKRLAAGFRNFDHYRLRVLLHTGGCDWTRLGTTPTT